MRPVQYFSDQYLQVTRKASPTQIATFLDEYRQLHTATQLRVDREPTKLISIRLPVKTLLRLKKLSKTRKVPYQTLMKQMIEDCLAGDLERP